MVVEACTTRSLRTLRYLAGFSTNFLSGIMTVFIGVGGLLYLKKVIGKSVEEFMGKDSTKQYDVKDDETVMKERFEQWRKQHFMIYWTNKEKAMCYQKIQGCSYDR